MPDNPLIMICGSGGLLGRALLNRFAPHYQIIALVHNQMPDLPGPQVRVEKVDLSDRKQASDIFQAYGPDILVNAVAWVDVDGCEKDRKRAYKANFVIVENLLSASRSGNCYFIQMSTDYIFNGAEYPGGIDDNPAPLNYYGRSKLMAEKHIVDNYANYLIARTCALFGSPDFGQTNLVKYYYENLRAGKEIEVPEDQYSNPIWVANLAELVEEAVRRRLKGVVHLGGRDYLSRFQFARLFAEIFSFDSQLIKPVTSYFQQRPAQRPRYAGLNIDQTLEKFETRILSVHEALAAIRAGLPEK